jgi:hypothetical protein
MSNLPKELQESLEYDPLAGVLPAGRTGGTSPAGAPPAGGPPPGAMRSMAPSSAMGSVLQTSDIELLEYAMRHDPDSVVALFRQQSWAKAINKEQLLSAVANMRAGLESPKTFSDMRMRAWTHQEALKLPPDFHFAGYSPPNDVYYPIDPGRRKFEEAGDWTGWLWNCAGPTIKKPAQAPFRYHTSSTKSFTYDDVLPDPTEESPVTVALCADFGTGEYQSWYIARQLELEKAPCVFHLGDVYYAGRQNEYDNYFSKPLANILKTSKVFDLAENHDEYAGKVPYYKFLNDNLKAPVPQAQEGSYFCVRNSKFQFIGLDTISQGRRVTDPLVRAWLRERLDEGRTRSLTTILLTGGEAFEYKQDAPETDLCRDLQTFTEDGDIHLWFWGNVHYAALYKPSINRPFYASCIGHGGFPFGAMTQERVGDHVLFLERGTRFPTPLGIRNDRGRNGWCRLRLYKNGNVGVEFIDWMSNPRFAVTLAHSPAAFTLEIKDPKNYPV